MQIADTTRGFLPAQDPLIQLPAAFAAWEEIGRQLPKLVLSDHLRRFVAELPPFPTAELVGEPAHWRAGTLLAYLTSLYVLGVDGAPLARIPAVLAVPFHDVAATLGVPPILSYALQAMYNWRRLDPELPVAAGNLTLLQNFLGGMDEEWFVTLHIQIEATAAPALSALMPLQTAVANHDVHAIEAALITIADTLETMFALLGRMPERCEPAIYYQRVRPFMFGWKDNPALPDGVIYEGVDAYRGRPQQFRGETGAQSGIIPAFDAALGISHDNDSMRVYLTELRAYMPPRDRAFVQRLEQGPPLRRFLQTEGDAPLKAAYNHCLRRLTQFRTRHIEYAARYILQPAKQETAVGTGGTPFTYYLKKHIKETEAHLL